MPHMCGYIIKTGGVLPLPRGLLMNIDSTTALLPVERAGPTAFLAGEDDRNNLPADTSRPLRELVFLGYGPPSGQRLYDGAGRYVSSMDMPGSVVDLYA